MVGIKSYPKNIIRIKTYFPKKVVGIKTYPKKGVGIKTFPKQVVAIKNYPKKVVGITRLSSLAPPVQPASVYPTLPQRWNYYFLSFRFEYFHAVFDADDLHPSPTPNFRELLLLMLF